jgi:hypothetical protein
MVALGLGLGLGLAAIVSCKPQPGQATAGQAVAGELPEALLDQVRYLRSETTRWYVPFGLESNGEWAPRLTGMGPDKKRFDNRVSAAAMIKPGEVFFATKEPFKDRFRFTGIVQKEIFNERTKSRETVSVAQYEDLRPNKSGTKYESQQGLPESDIEAHAYHDRTAVLDFGKADGERRELKVEEGASFPLPDGAGEKSFLLKEVKDDEIVIEYEDPAGSRKQRSFARIKTP